MQVLLKTRAVESMRANNLLDFTNTIPNLFHRVLLITLLLSRFMKFFHILFSTFLLFMSTQSVSAYQELLIDRLEERNINVVRVVLD